jgi:polysaccharide transporter, PST family
MLERLKNIFLRKEYKQIIENFFSLSILNMLSYIFPLITLPFLVRILGVEKFGTVSFALTIFQYIILLSNYGFSFSATREISINRENKEQVSQIFSSVLVIRICIAVICFLLLLLSMLFFKKISDEAFLYFFGFGIVLGDIIMPVWLFQGMEKMKYVSIVNIFLKGIFTILIFLVLRKTEDYPLVLLLNSFGYLSAGLLSMYFAFRHFGIRFVMPQKTELVRQLHEGKHIFVSTIFINFYRNSNIFILGILTNDIFVGYYASAERIIKAIQSLLSPVSESLYPYFSLRFEINNREDNYRILFKLGRFYFIGLFIISSILLLVSKPLIVFFLGGKFLHSINDIQIMSYVILFGGMNYFLGIIGLINMGYKKQFTIFVFISGIISILISVLFCRILFDVAASTAMLAGEFVLFVLLIFFLRNQHRKIVPQFS